MGKTLFGISSAAFIVAFVVGFAVADSQARHAARATIQLSPSMMTSGANQMPPEHFADYSFVFNFARLIVDGWPAHHAPSLSLGGQLKNG
jgi:hypothetical protein